MFGYIQPLKSELKIREYDVFRAYYCGVCRSMAERHMQLPRFALSNDCVFLALLLSSVYCMSHKVKKFRCIIHPTKKRPCAERNNAIDYAADVNIILAWYKAKDDLKDGDILAGVTQVVALKRAFSKIKKRWLGSPVLALKLKKITDCLEDLEVKERSECDNMDETGDAFAKLTGCIFSWSSETEVGDNANLRALDWLGYNIGKWIYIADAWKDIENDINKNRYNPIAAACGWEIMKAEGRSTGDFRNCYRERIERLLTSCLEQASTALSLLNIESNREILENIIYLGLRRKMEDILDE